MSEEKRSLLQRASDFLFKPEDNRGASTGRNNIVVVNGRAADRAAVSTRVYGSIQAIASELKKVEIRHIRGDNGTVMDSQLSRVLSNPNDLMTKSDFMEKSVHLLFKKDNLFIYPMYSPLGDILGLYPLNYTDVELRRYRDGELAIYFKFNNGVEQLLPYRSVIHVRRNYSDDDIMGGSSSGSVGSDELKDLLNLNSKLNDNIIKSTKSTFNGIIEFDSIIEMDSQEKAIEEFNKKLENSESGIIGIDKASSYKEISRQGNSVDRELVEYIDNKVSEFFGVPPHIIRGDFSKIQLEAFIQKTVEPLMISFQQAFNKALFTPKEKGHGNKIIFYYNKAILMTVPETLELVRLLGDSGTITENEKRELVGLPPLADLDGVITMSKNYGNRADIESGEFEYKVKKAEDDKDKESEKDKDKENDKEE